MTCRCGHLVHVHDYGTRKGARIRTRCLHGDPSGPCDCKLFAPATPDAS